jgi:hypothetical protein
MSVQEKKGKKRQSRKKSLEEEFSELKLTDDQLKQLEKLASSNKRSKKKKVDFESDDEGSNVEVDSQEGSDTEDDVSEDEDEGEDVSEDEVSEEEDD